MSTATNTEYLNSNLAFELCSIENDWPTPQNAFMAKAATNLTVGRRFEDISCADVLTIVSSFLRTNQSKILTSEIQFNNDVSTGPLTFTVIDIREDIIPPITSDNAGFFSFAMNWFLQNDPTKHTVSFCKNGLFWVHA